MKTEVAFGEIQESLNIIYYVCNERDFCSSTKFTKTSLHSSIEYKFTNIN